MAELLGYEPRVKIPRKRSRRSTVAPVSEAPPEVAKEASSAIPFWRVVGYEAIDSADEVETKGRRKKKRLAPFDAAAWDCAPAAVTPLGAFSAMAPALRRAAAERRETKEPDVRALLRKIGRGQIVDALPMTKRRRWGDSLLVVMDRDERLIPYRDDYSRIFADIAKIFPKETVRVVLWAGEGRDPVPQAGTVVVAMTDLGLLSQSGDRAARDWLAYGRALRGAGCRCVAILPATPILSMGGVAGVWGLVGWRPFTKPLDAARRRELLQELLTLSAPAVNVEPGLLRELRLLLGADADPGLEAAFWQSPALLSGHPSAATVEWGERKKLLAVFAGLDRETRKRALTAIRGWRRRDRLPLWSEETLSLDADSRDLIAAEDLRAASREFIEIAEMVERGAAPPGSLAWFRRTSQRLPLPGWAVAKTKEERQALMRLWRAAHPETTNAPPGYDPALLPRSVEPRRRYVLRQRGERLVVMPAEEAFAHGGALGTIAARRPEFTIEAHDDFWASGRAPDFAQAWGWDEFGRYLEFSVAGPEGPVTQRMRWIPPGRFLMGSSDKEAQRFDSEGPQHEVTISKGFWLFDTTCTQELWKAVMEENPSRFQGSSKLPVETVSWNDAREFIARIETTVPGLRLSLPTEAQWEYACRAGTKTPFSFGETITPEQVNYDGNYPYGGARKGLYRQTTVPVGSLPPNAWGLHEMHGNVWEWVEDAWHGDYTGAPIDGSAWKGGSAARRVLRGGSWDGYARLVRSALRGARGPGGRGDDVGFRCARVQEGAEPAETRRIRQAERRIAASPSGEAAAATIVRVGAEGAAVFPRGGPFVIRGDIERLYFEGLLRPEWASAIGRDRFGLWTEFEVGGEPNPVAQRMRWISPGRFLMGSPRREIDRFNDEGPQHQVTISKGFWLFDTACRQSLWQAVMGENPSQFEGAGRPVENVSWEDCQRFLERVNALIPDLNLGLPSEAQWEYACRAGTTTPFSFGETITPDQVNYNGDHPYAGAPKGLFRQTTVPVGSLPPNAWGLHEMHGNVWEWCADGSRAYEDAAVIDPLGSTEGATERVLRGGSWYSLARNVRSARRFASVPGDRDDVVGFRCARVQE